MFCKYIVKLKSMQHESNKGDDIRAITLDNEICFKIFEREINIHQRPNLLYAKQIMTTNVGENHLIHTKTKGSTFPKDS